MYPKASSVSSGSSETQGGVLGVGRWLGRGARTCSSSPAASRARGGPEVPGLAGKTGLPFPKVPGPRIAGQGGALGLAARALPPLPRGAPARRTGRFLQPSDLASTLHKGWVQCVRHGW